MLWFYYGVVVVVVVVLVVLVVLVVVVVVVVWALYTTLTLVGAEQGEGQFPTVVQKRLCSPALVGTAFNRAVNRVTKSTFTVRFTTWLGFVVSRSGCTLTPDEVLP